MTIRHPCPIDGLPFTHGVTQSIVVAEPDLSRHDHPDQSNPGLTGGAISGIFAPGSTREGGPPGTLAVGRGA